MAATLGDEAKARFPRLLAALQCAASLDEADAVNVLVEYQVFGIRNELAALPVARLGGQLAAIRHAIRHRGASRDTRCRAHGSTNPS